MSHLSSQHFTFCLYLRQFINLPFPEYLIQRSNKQSSIIVHYLIPPNVCAQYLNILLHLFPFLLIKTIFSPSSQTFRQVLLTQLQQSFPLQTNQRLCSSRHAHLFRFYDIVPSYLGLTLHLLFHLHYKSLTFFLSRQTLIRFIPNLPPFNSAIFLSLVYSKLLFPFLLL